MNKHFPSVEEEEREGGNQVHQNPSHLANLSFIEGSGLTVPGYRRFWSFCFESTLLYHCEGTHIFINMT